MATTARVSMGLSVVTKAGRCRGGSVTPVKLYKVRGWYNQ